ncbi:hypothetical protein Sar04_29680 [Salinispora arenicola]|uniref:Uncharacterized protein n=1 Tax=Salinispora arenicola TaxID=168697 RepID=A0ABQ4JTE3_SALAC|nr:hypothetical protein Sar04_29680 [Salinispora arenicola]
MPVTAFAHSRAKTAMPELAGVLAAVGWVAVAGLATDPPHTAEEP